MQTQQITVTPLTTSIGAELGGIDLGQPLTDSTMNTIYRALIDHLVIFVRGQEITPQQHLAFAQHFGRLDEPHPVYRHVQGFDRIVEFANDASNPPDTDGWHTDLTFKPDPPFASILVARDVPDSGGDTLWSSMYAAYDALPDEMKSRLDTLVALDNMGDFRNNFTMNQSSGEKRTDAMRRFGCTIHKVVKTHPISGRKYLYVNESFAVHIIGKTARESRRLLNYLLDHIGRPEYQVRFKWSPGALAMWDNRCTQHYAVNDYLPAYRRMNRITVVEDKRAISQSTAL